MSDLEKVLNPKCSTEDKKEKLRKMYDEFLEDIDDTFNEIASNIYGPFLPTLFALTAQLGVGAALDYSAFVGKMVTRNTVGGFIASVGLAVGTLNGSKTLLKYAAAKSLEEGLEKRKTLSLALLDEVESLLSLLFSFEDINVSSERALLGEIEKALLSVKRAMVIVGQESSKINSTDPVQFTQNPVSPNNLQRAIDHIEDALLFLGGSRVSSDLYDDKLNKLNKKYSLDIIPKNNFTDSVGMADPLNIVNYFKEATDQIREDNTEDGILTKKGQRILRYYIIDFINTPGVNQFFKTFAAAGLLDGHVSTLGKKIPIRSSISASFAKEEVKKSLGGTLGPIEDFAEETQDVFDNVFSYLKLQPYGSKLQFPEDTTLQLSGLEVITSETSILLINERFDSLQTQTGALKKFLTPALNNLDEVSREMEDTIYNSETIKDSSEVFSLASQKIEWMGKLNLSKTLISSGVETPIYLGSSKIPVSTYDINKKFSESDVYYKQLQDHIRSRLIDENGERIDTEWEQIIDIANSTLSSFAFGPIALFNPKARDKAIGGLQSIRLLLRDQISEDTLELTDARFYINSVEANPLFSSVIKPAWEEMLKRLSASTMGEDISKALSRGNLSTLLNAMEAGRFASNAVKDFFECGEEPIGVEDRKRIENMASIIGVDGDEAIKQVREADAQISRLINKGKLLKILEDS